MGDENAREGRRERGKRSRVKSEKKMESHVVGDGGKKGGEEGVKGAKSGS